MISVQQEHGLDRIGGWLILFLTGLLLTPIRLGVVLYKTFVPLFSDGTFGQLTTPSSDLYHPLWAPLIAFELIGNLSVIALGLVTLYHFLRKSRKTKKYAIAWLLTAFAFVVIDFFFADMIPSIAVQPADPESIKEVARSTVSAAIWVPYFLVSKRVKATFTR